uniref:Uncharacterized protein n=1 Tax=Rhizophora mucronata TaxID=61149 RepID=A0A2P2PHS3_RHIMU
MHASLRTIERFFPTSACPMKP